MVFKYLYRTASSNRSQRTFTIIYIWRKIFSDNIDVHGQHCTSTYLSCFDYMCISNITITIFYASIQRTNHVCRSLYCRPLDWFCTCRCASSPLNTQTNPSYHVVVINILCSLYLFINPTLMCYMPIKITSISLSVSLMRSVQCMHHHKVLIALYSIQTSFIALTTGKSRISFIVCVVCSFTSLHHTLTSESAQLFIQQYNIDNVKHYKEHYKLIFIINILVMYNCVWQSFNWFDFIYILYFIYCMP